MTVAAVNSLAAASVAAINGVAEANIAAVNGLTWPAGGAGSTTLWSTTDLTPGGGVWTLSNGDTRATEATGSDANIRATAGISDGTAYWELIVDRASGSGFSVFVGIRRSDEAIGTGATSGQTLVWRSSGTMFAGSTGATNYNSPNPGTFTVGAHLKFALNMTAGVRRFWFGRVGVGWEGGRDPTNSSDVGANMFAGVPAGTWIPFVSCNNDGNNHQIDLINGTDIAFTDTPPTGFNPLP